MFDATDTQGSCGRPLIPEMICDGKLKLTSAKAALAPPTFPIPPLAYDYLHQFPVAAGEYSHNLAAKSHASYSLTFTEPRRPKSVLLSC